MTERTMTDGLIRVLKRELPKCVIIKHADRFTVGVPDMSVSWNGATTWLELKLLRKSQTVLNRIDHSQLVMCAKLEAATKRCWIVVAHTNSKLVMIYRPTALLTVRPALFSLWHGATGSARFDYGEVIEVIRGTHDYLC